jgi:cysteine desulfurase/selenocysteine lyase
MAEMNRFRKDFQILKREVHPGKKLVYLDNAATTHKPDSVIKAIKDYYEQHNANIHRGVHKLSEEATEAYIDAHEKAASFINAPDSENIVFTRNTTESINLVMRSYGLKSGDEVVTSVMEHHSNLVPWLMLREQGIKVRFADIDEEGRLDLGKFERLLNKNTKLVALTHISNVLGTVNPVEKIGDMVRDAGAAFLVDAAQSVPHMGVDVKRIDCDFLAFSGHKMLGPTGTGVLFGKTEELERMSPFMYGGDMIKEVTLEGATWNDLPWKFEAGTPNVAGGIGLGAAVEYLEKAGMEDIRDHEKALTRYALEKLEDIPEVRQYGPRDLRIRGGVLSFMVDGIHPHDVATILDSEGIAIRSGHHCAQPLMKRLGIHATSRASFYLYNTRQEIDRLCDAIGKVKRVFKHDK